MGSRILVSLLVVATAAPMAAAQLAPLGAHHADGRPTGAAGGGASAVPLELPPSRGGLPIPVAIVHGGGGFGAAGRGWDVPLSFLREDRSLAHRRPSANGGAPAARAEVVLSLMGSTVRLVPDGEAWAAQRGLPGLVARKIGARWAVSDGRGVMYGFEERPPEAQLPGVYLLTRIEGRDGARIDLEYETPVSATGATSVDLRWVRYNVAEGSPKNEIELVYEGNATSDLGASVLGTRMIVRKRKLDRIEIRARATPGSTPELLTAYHLGYESDPDTGAERLAKVTRTGRSTAGQSTEHLPVVAYTYGTATRPVTSPGGHMVRGLKYEPSSTVTMPAAAVADEISSSAASGFDGYGDPNRWFTQQNLVDMNGDGRLDLVYPKNGGLWIARNAPSGGEPTLAPASQNGVLNGGPMTMNHLDAYGATRRVLQCHADVDCPSDHSCDDAGQCIGNGSTCTSDYECQLMHPGVWPVCKYAVGPEGTTATTGHCSSPQPNCAANGQCYQDTVSDTWRSLADVNGDGRPDLVVADELDGDRWVVYLNTPNAANPEGITWKRQVHSVAHLATLLRSHGHRLRSPHVPLARQHTGLELDVDICWARTNAGGWVAIESASGLGPQGQAANACGHQVAEGELPTFIFGYKRYRGERTHTEWKLVDVNGDGGLDLAMNSTPVTMTVTRPEPTAVGDYVKGHRQYRLGPAGGDENVVKVVYNVSILEPVPQSEELALLSSACGVASWGHDIVHAPCGPTLACNAEEDEGDPSLPSCDSLPDTCEPVISIGEQYQVCDIRELNGDGLPDRYEAALPITGGAPSARYHLGTGQGFAVGSRPLPAALHYRHKRPNLCDTGADEREARAVISYRDVNGDRIPDLVEHGNAPQVRLGNGVGFGSALLVDGPLGEWDQANSCDGTRARTIGGLYDVDGDGLAEAVTVSAGTLQLHRLVTGDGVRSYTAGRLSTIDNGYGAVTRYRYKSAKDDTTTRHQVPVAEIVVSAIETTVAGVAGKSETRFAYGGAALAFDSVAGRFTFPGYARSVAMTILKPGPEAPQTEAQATVTDHQPLEGPASVSAVELLGRHLRVGAPKEVALLAGALGDPWTMLATDVASLSARVGGSTMEYDVRVSGDDGGMPDDPDCLELLNPYAAPGSAAYSEMNTCTTRGFLFQRAVRSWRGSAAPPSLNNVETESRAIAVDALGRVTVAYHANDTRQPDDDLCVHMSFASPAGTAENEIRFAPWSRRVGQCADDYGLLTTLAAERFEYDNLPAGWVTNGVVTSQTVEPRDTQTGAPLGPAVRLYDLVPDAHGNPLVTTTLREDGATRTTTLGYDPFHLVPVHKKVEASHAATLETDIERDPLTLAVVTVTDPNGTQAGFEHDAFGRTTMATVTPPGGTPGALSVTSYEGFAGAPPLSRRIVTKTFDDPVPIATAATAPGRTHTVHLDGAARATKAELALGADYAGEALIVGATTYDAAGRVIFTADPHPKSENSATAYGTTVHFRPDGTVWCSVRGHGYQPATGTYTSDETQEIFPSCLERRYENGTEIVEVMDADARLAGAPQHGLARREQLTALGRPLERSTWQNGIALERATMAHDRLGHQVKMTRFGDPIASGWPVEWTWRYDSTGQVVRYEEPDSAPRLRTYSNWGELVEEMTPKTTSPAQPEQRQIMRYDGLGRLVHAEETVDGEVDAETVFDYVYDTGMSVTPAVTPAGVLGRLAHASAPTGTTYFSYDPLGRTAARTFTDATSGVYVERTERHAGGALRALELLLPDNGYVPERIEYQRDSAGRTQRVQAVDGGATQLLYQALQIDALGRVRQARTGATTHTATYAPSGRRLLKEIKVSSGSGTRTRSFPSVDPVGRERVRVEEHDGSVETTTVGYDALGRVVSSLRQNGSTTLSMRGFGYDALGNLQHAFDPLGQNGAHLAYQGANRDRLCAIGYGTNGPPGLCNVVHDAVGNIVEQETRTGKRWLSYFASGAVRTIKEDGALATFRYDPFGVVQELDIEGTTTDRRRDRRYGNHVELREVSAGGAVSTVLTRRLPLPGMVAARNGAGRPWLFSVTEQRGNRAFVDQEGRFVQDVHYEPFGEATSSGAQPGTEHHSSRQWNQGDALAAFGVAHLGARVYDPVIGRFLSPDPLVIPRTAATTNPYAFAANDPVNRADPTGLDWDDPDPPISTNPVPIVGVVLIELYKRATSTSEKFHALMSIEEVINRTVSADFGVDGAFNIRSLDVMGMIDKGFTFEDILAAARASGNYLDAVDRQHAAIDARKDFAAGILDRTQPLCWTGGCGDGRERWFGVKVRDQAAYDRGSSSGLATLGGALAAGAVGAIYRVASGGGAVAAGACGNGPCSRKCFVAGTPVTKGDGRAVPIEQIRLGDRVDANDPSCADDHLPADAVTIRLEVRSPTDRDDVTRIELVRSREWLAASGLGSAETYLLLEELGVAGWARVRSVGPPPEETPGSGCLVLMTVTHVAPEILRLGFDDGTTLELTPSHPLFVEGAGWVRAGDMTPGQDVRTDLGPLRLARVERADPNQRVYNVEVARQHMYKVSARKVWAHNNCWDQIHKTMSVITDLLEKVSETRIPEIMARWPKNEQKAFYLYMYVGHVLGTGPAPHARYAGAILARSKITAEQRETLGSLMDEFAGLLGATRVFIDTIVLD